MLQDFDDVTSGLRERSARVGRRCSIHDELNEAASYPGETALALAGKSGWVPEIAKADHVQTSARQANATFTSCICTENVETSGACIMF